MTYFVTRIANELFQIKKLQRLQVVVKRMKCILLQICRLCVFCHERITSLPQN